MITVATVVEGRGEALALPTLIHRVAQAHGVYDLKVPRPWVLDSGRFLIPAEFERAIELQSREIGGHGGVLALLDADKERCPGRLAARIRDGYRAQREFAIVVALPEYESIFLAGHEPEPEGHRDAKRRVSKMLGRPYHPARDQRDLSSRLDLDLARNCGWFRKFERELLRILGR